MNTLEIVTQSSVETVYLNRPTRLNCINHEMLHELTEYFHSLERRDELRIVVLRANGDNFCAGLDLAEFADDELPQKPDLALRTQRQLSRLILKMRACPQPIICALHGAVSGGGLALALASDIRIAAEDVRMNAAFIRIGLTGCDVGVSYFLPRLVGTAVAREMLMTGRFLEAERALSTGLVNEIQPYEKLDEAVGRLLDEMLSASPLGLRLTKEAMDINTGPVTLDAALALEDRQQVLAVASGEFTSRARAFLSKKDST